MRVVRSASKLLSLGYVLRQRVVALVAAYPGPLLRKGILQQGVQASRGLMTGAHVCTGSRTSMNTSSHQQPSSGEPSRCVW
jgi:hypothetical protein